MCACIPFCYLVVVVVFTARVDVQTVTIVTKQCLQRVIEETKVTRDTERRSVPSSCKMSYYSLCNSIVVDDGRLNTNTQMNQSVVVVKENPKESQKKQFTLQWLSRVPMSIQHHYMTYQACVQVGGGPVPLGKIYTPSIFGVKKLLNFCNT